MQKGGYVGIGADRIKRRQLRDIEWRIVLRVAVFAGLGKRIILARALGIAALAPGMRILPRR